MKVWKQFAALCCATMLLSACSSSDSDEPGTGTGPTTPPGQEQPAPENQPVVATGMNATMLVGTVCDAAGQALSGVQVTSGDASTMTDDNGAFALTKVGTVENRAVVKFSKYGYRDIVRSLGYQRTDSWNVVMESVNSGNYHNHTYASNEAATLSAGGMKVDMPADGYMVVADGKAYSGPVETNMVYLTPEDENFADKMPGGDLAAVRADGSEAQLVSYGMTCVNMTDANGNKLQLKSGSKAKLNFPIPAGMEEHPTIPLWSFDEEKGVWVEEGEAKLVGDHYEGEVSHFSWVNLDYPSIRATLNVKVVDTDGAPIPGLTVKVGQLSRITATDGTFTTYVPSETAFTVSADLGLYGGDKTDIKSVPVSPLSAGDVKDVTLTFPKVYHVKGAIVNSAGGSKMVALTLKYTDKGVKYVTKIRTNNEDGTFDLVAPIGYAGTATLHIASLEGPEIDKEITLGSNDINLGQIDLKARTEESSLSIKVKGQVMTLPVKISALSGMERYGSSYSYYTEDENSNLSLGIEKYPEGLMVMFNYSMHTDSKYINLWAESFPGREDEDTDQPNHHGNVKVTLEKNGEFYNVTISGTCRYMEENKGSEDAEGGWVEDMAEIQPTVLRVPVDIEADIMRDVDVSTCRLPSFTPTLSGNAPMVLLINQKGVDVGGVIYYNGDANTFAELKAKADKSGLIYDIDESSDTDDAIEAVYSKGTDYLEIKHNKRYAYEITAETEWYRYMTPQIQVTAFNNFEGYNSYRVRAEKALKAMLAKKK